MLGRTGVAHYGRRCSWAHSEGHIGVAHWEEVLMGPFRGGTHSLHLCFSRKIYFRVSVIGFNLCLIPKFSFSNTI